MQYDITASDKSCTLTIHVLFAATLSSVRILYVTCTKTTSIVQLMCSCKQEHNFPIQHREGGSLYGNAFVNNCRLSQE